MIDESKFSKRNNKLVSDVKSFIQENSLGEEIEIPSIRTGIDVLDYRNGKYDYDKSGKKVKILGISCGKILMIIGKSGSAKTTLAIQIATNIISNFIEMGGFIQFQDFEHSTEMQRLMSLTGIKNKEYIKSLFVKPETNLNTENTFNIIKKIRKLKKGEEALSGLSKNEQKKFQNPFLFTFPNGVIYPIPTPLIIDSLATMMPKNVEEDDDIAGNMSAAAVAKKNSSFFKGLLNDFSDANIMPIIINHINTKIDINPFSKQPAELNFLKPDEALPGGKTSVFLTNTLWKLVTSRKLTEDKEFGIKGFVVRAELIKSRSNAAGLSADLIYDQVNGFDNLLSNLNLLKDSDMLGGTGRGFYIKGFDNFKFQMKNFREQYEGSDGLKKAFDEAIDTALENFIPDPNSLVYNENDVFNKENLNEELEEDLQSMKRVKIDGEIYYKSKSGKYFNTEGEEVEFVD